MDEIRAVFKRWAAVVCYFQDCMTTRQDSIGKLRAKAGIRIAGGRSGGGLLDLLIQCEDECRRINLPALYKWEGLVDELRGVGGGDSPPGES